MYRNAARPAILILLTIAWATARPAAAQVATYAQEDIAFGANVYVTQCQNCHGPGGDGVGGVELRSGRFRRAATDQDLARVVTYGIEGTGMMAFKLNAAEVTGIVAYLRNMASFDPTTVKIGSADRGRALFESRNCQQCHRVAGRGSHIAPDLTEIGNVRSAASLQRSLVDPASQMMPINRPVHLVTKDGRTINGRRLNEDTYTVQLIDDQERLLSFAKADLRELTVLMTSSMPSYKDRLTNEELADLLAYLLSLRGR